MRIGNTTGTRVASRIVWTLSTSRTAATSRTSRSVAITSGSPPLMITSLISGWARRYASAGASASSERAPPPAPTRRLRVQKRQYTAQRSVANRSARSG